MNFTNLNTFSTIIFLIFLIISVFIAYKNYYEYKKSWNIYRFFSVIFLLISFVTLSVWLFWVKVLRTENNSYLWTNIVFVLDVSKSMKALDFEENWESYSRLSASKKFISDFVIKNPWNRYALVVFAWEAERALPFTSDTNLFLTILSWVDENNVSVQWTNINDALTAWLRSFTKDDNSWLIVMLSDWDDDGFINSKDLEKWKKENDIKTVVVWVWTSKWAYIPIWNNPFWEVIYKTYNWQRVVTKLWESSLKELAKSLSWEYYNLDDLWRLDKVESILSNLSKKVFYSKTENFIDMTRLITFISFILFIIYLAFLIKYDNRKK